MKIKNILGILEKDIELNLKVKSLFEGEFYINQFPSLHGYDIERCFSLLPFPLTSICSNKLEDEERKSLLSSEQGGFIYGEDDCVYFIGRDPYD